jgi:hypothetical protein
MRIPKYRPWIGVPLIFVLAIIDIVFGTYGWLCYASIFLILLWAIYSEERIIRKKHENRKKHHTM